MYSMSIYTTDLIAGREHGRPLNEDAWLVFGLVLAVQLIFILKKNNKQKKKTESCKLALGFEQWIHSGTAETEPDRQQSALDYP